MKVKVIECLFILVFYFFGNDQSSDTNCAEIIYNCREKQGNRDSRKEIM